MGKLIQWLTPVVHHNVYIYIMYGSMLLLFVAQYLGKYHNALFTITSGVAAALALFSFLVKIYKKNVERKWVWLFVAFAAIPVYYWLSAILHQDFSYSARRITDLKYVWPLLALIFLFVPYTSFHIEKILAFAYLFALLGFAAYQMSGFVFEVWFHDYPYQFHEYLITMPYFLDLQHHITSVAFAIGMALCLTLIEVENATNKNKIMRTAHIVFLLLLVILFFIGIVLSGARMGLASAFLVGAIYFIFKLRKGAYYLVWPSIALALLLMVSIYFLYQHVPAVKIRTDITLQEFKMLKEHDFSGPLHGYGNLTVRIIDLIYYSDLMYDNVWIGKGPSQEKFLAAQDALHAQKKGPSHVFELRPANYWFRTIVMLGFPMAILFFATFCAPLFMLKNRMFFSMVWMCLFVFSNMEDLFDNRIYLYFITTTYFFAIRLSMYLLPHTQQGME